MEYENTDLKTRIVKHYLLPTAALIYCLFGVIAGEMTMFTLSGSISLSGSEALILSIAPMLWLFSDLIMFEPKLQLPKVKRLTFGVLLLIPAGYIFYIVLLT